MRMKHDQVGNPYHINNNIERRKGLQEEKALDQIYTVLDKMLLELKAIHEHLECPDHEKE
jgi:hypothetical protein